MQRLFIFINNCKSQYVKSWTFLSASRFLLIFFYEEVFRNVFKAASYYIFCFVCRTELFWKLAALKSLKITETIHLVESFFSAATSLRKKITNRFSEEIKITIFENGFSEEQHLLTASDFPSRGILDWVSTIQRHI